MKKSGMSSLSSSVSSDRKFPFATPQPPGPAHSQRIGQRLAPQSSVLNAIKALKKEKPEKSFEILADDELPPIVDTFNTPSAKEKERSGRNALGELSNSIIKSRQTWAPAAHLRKQKSASLVTKARPLYLLSDEEELEDIATEPQAFSVDTKTVPSNLNTKIPFSWRKDVFPEPERMHLPPSDDMISYYNSELESQADQQYIPADDPIPGPECFNFASIFGFASEDFKSEGFDKTNESTNTNDPAGGNPASK